MGQSAVELQKRDLAMLGSLLRWVLLPPSIAASLSPLSFDLEKRVLNRYPRRELPVALQSRAYTWSQVRGFRRLYAQTRQEWPRGPADRGRSART